MRLLPALLLAAAGALLRPLHARAQLNQLTAADTLRLQARLTAAGSYLDGNARRVLLHKLDVAYAQPGWGLSAREEYQYGRTNGRQTEADLLSWNFLYRHPLRRSYPYLMLLAESNYRRGLRWRYQPGLGLSYALRQRPGQLLRASLTGSFEYSRYRAGEFEHYDSGGSPVIRTWRLTGRLFGRQALLTGRLRLLGELWYQQSVQHRQSYRYLAEGSVEVPVSKRVALRAGARYTYERIELVGNKPSDLFTTYGFTLSNF